MRPRRAMLRSFIAEQYADEPLAQVVGDPDGPLAGAAPGALINAALAPMLLPHLVEAVEEVIVKAGEQPKVRGFAGGLLTYVYNPLDLLQSDGLIGWVDDALVCALGLRKLDEAGLIELDDHTRAVVELVSQSLTALPTDLRNAIESFVVSLWESGASPITSVR